MRVIVISDTHGSYANLCNVVKRNMSADAFIHLGDGEKEYRLLMEALPELSKKFYYVRGNCDYGGDGADYRVIDIAPGYRIFATHGHLYGVNFSLATLTGVARDNRCNIALYGHTHVRRCSYDNGVYIMNPGSASRPRDGQPPSYGYIDITDSGVMTSNVSL